MPPIPMPPALLAEEAAAAALVAASANAAPVYEFVDVPVYVHDQRKY